MIKWQRNYKLVYTIPPEKEGESPKQITITYPLTCEFDINRNTFAQSNRATFRIYNLALSTRNQIYQDIYNIYRYCFVDFYAGYGDNMPLIFTGKVLTAMSERENTDMITTIEALDNDIIQSYSSHTFAAGTPKKEVLNTLVGDFSNVQLGATGTLEGNLSNNLIFDDLTFECINKLTGGHSFIDLNQLNTLQNNEVLGDYGIYKLTSKSGLLGTPRRQQAQLEVDCIFAPEIRVGQLVDIESVTSPDQYNGQYKCIGIHHSGIISGAVCGEAKTTLNLFVGAFLPNSNFVWSGVTSQPVSEVKNDEVKPLNNKELNTIQDVYKYLLKNKKPPNKKITSGIKWTDVLLNYTAQGSTPSIDVLSNLYAVSQQLQSFVDKFYPNAKIQISSGWRSQTYNAKIPGAARDSQHINGKALDFKLSGQANYYVYNYLKKYWNGWSKLYDWGIHVDIRYTTVRGIANDR